MTIKNQTLEYENDTHTYLIDGVIRPSVTQVIKEVMPKYDYERALIPEVVKRNIMRASERGTFVHKSIEDFCKGRKELKESVAEVRDFDFLMQYYGFEVLENETPVIVEHEGVQVAGRLDLVLLGENGRAIADIKTTATLDREYLTYQLNLYRIGYQQCYGKEINELYGIHLKDVKRKLAPIPINESVAYEVIEKFKKGEIVYT